MTTGYPGGAEPRRFLIATAVAKHAFAPGWDRPGLIRAREEIIALFTERLGYTHVSDLGINPTSTQLTGVLRSFCAAKDRRGNDLIAVYITAHGERLTATDEHVILTADTDPDDPEDAMPTAVLARKILLGTQVRRLLLILDTCYSGQGGAQFAATALSGLTGHWSDTDHDAGVVVVSSTQPLQLAEAGAFPRLLRAAVDNLATAGHGPHTLALDAVVNAMNTAVDKPATQRIEYSPIRLTGPAPDFLVVYPSAESIAQPGTGYDRSHNGGGGKPVVPRQLPREPRRFAGREAELRVLTEVLDSAADATATVVISAIGGVGKTQLTVYWAHEHLDRFPDGQLFIDLRGFSPAGEPMSVAEAVRGFLHGLGEDPTKLPVEPNAQIGLYRSLVADRQMLIVLDNARDTSQVELLLPGSSTCTVIVTSRSNLPGLVTSHGAHFLELAVLSEAESHRLLGIHLGTDRMVDESDAVNHLLVYCAGLPLALSIVAARARAHTNFPLAVLADELHDEKTRLDGLDAGEISLNLRAVFSCSWKALSDAAATLFALLGLAPGPDIGLISAAELAGLPRSETRTLLRELETAHLVSQPLPGRYQLHDLLRLYASEQARQQLTEAESGAALGRLLEFLLHTAYTAERILDPHRHPVRIDPPASDCHPLPLADQETAQAWLEAEHSGLLAGQQLAATLGRHTLVWQLAWSLGTFHCRREYLQEWRSMWELGLDSARRSGDPAVTSMAHRLLGDAQLSLGNLEAALEQLSRALGVAEDAGDGLAQAHAHRILTWAYGRRGDDREALEHAESALRLYQELGEQVREAAMLNAVGWFEARLGDLEQASRHCDAALRLCRKHEYRVGEANTLVSLGYVAQRADRTDEALNYYQDALAMFQEQHSTYYHADTLDRMGQIYATTGREDAAREVWKQALQMYQEKCRPSDADRVRSELACLDDVGQI